MDFLKDIVKEIGGEYTQLASDIEETETYVDTGSYIFNALVSGSIFGGVSGNKITAIAGESSTGKTFFSLAVVKNFLDNNPTGYCLYFDTEAAITRSLLESRGIDTTRVVVVNVVTVEEFRGKALKAVDLYLKKPEGERNPCMFVLDSLGMLSTSKEINDEINRRFRPKTASYLKKRWGDIQLKEMAEADGMGIAQDVLSMASLADPTGVVGAVASFTKPICQTVIPFPSLSGGY